MLRWSLENALGETELASIRPVFVSFSRGMTG